MSPDAVAIMQQIHRDSWFWILLFFVLSFLLTKNGKTKFLKITHGLLRLVFIIMIVTGAGMLIAYKFPLAYMVKGVLAVLMIGVIEMVLGRVRRKERTGPLWGAFVFLLAMVLLIAFRVITF